MSLIIDTTTGTVLNAKHCVFLEDDALSDAEWESFEIMSDSEVNALGRERGRPVLPDVRALDAVAALLNAEDWSSDHLNAVADMVRSTGRTVEDVQ